MRSRALVRLLLLSVPTLALSLARPARACSICGCDPSAGTLGVDRPSPSTLRFSLEDRYLQKESGTEDDAEGEKEDRLTLRAQYAPIAQLVLALDVPVYLWKAHFDAAGAQDFTKSGLADLALTGRYELLRAGGLVPKHVLAIIGTVKLPTGANDLHLDGEEPDEHIQLGTGTFDGMFGLSYVYGELPWVAYANVTARLNGRNSRDFRYGNAVFGTLGVRHNFLESRKLLVSLEAQLRSAGKDLSADGSSDPDSGGQLAYASAAVAYAFAEALYARAVVQIPVVAALNGAQSEHPIGYLGLAYDLPLG